MMQNSKPIKIPGRLYSELVKVTEKSVFPSVDDLILYILQDYLDKQEAPSEQSTLQPDEEIRKRLQDLGYL